MEPSARSQASDRSPSGETRSSSSVSGGVLKPPSIQQRRSLCNYFPCYKESNEEVSGRCRAVFLTALKAERASEAYHTHLVPGVGP
jgi:hypothetical protein